MINEYDVSAPLSGDTKPQPMAVLKGDHVPEFEYHRLYVDQPNASAVLQGWINRIYQMEAGESAPLPYFRQHEFMNIHRMKMFLYTFGYDVRQMPDDVSFLWDKIKKLFVVGQPKAEPKALEEMKVVTKR